MLTSVLGGAPLAGCRALAASMHAATNKPRLFYSKYAPGPELNDLLYYNDPRMRAYVDFRDSMGALQIEAVNTPHGWVDMPHTKYWWACEPGGTVACAGKGFSQHSMPFYGQPHRGFMKDYGFCVINGPARTQVAWWHDLPQGDSEEKIGLKVFGWYVFLHGAGRIKILHRFVLEDPAKLADFYGACQLDRCSMNLEVDPFFSHVLWPEPLTSSRAARDLCDRQAPGYGLIEKQVAGSGCAALGRQVAASPMHDNPFGLNRVPYMMHHASGKEIVMARAFPEYRIRRSPVQVPDSAVLGFQETGPETGPNYSSVISWRWCAHTSGCMSPQQAGINFLSDPEQAAGRSAGVEAADKVTYEELWIEGGTTPDEMEKRMRQAPDLF